MLLPDSRELLCFQHVKPAVPEVMHIGLLNQIPQKFPSGKPVQGPVKRIIQIEEGIDVVLPDGFLLPLQNVLKLVHASQQKL
ncbi:hypothetical protein D3C73_945410 [compost metagenome]